MHRTGTSPISRWPEWAVWLACLAMVAALWIGASQRIAYERQQTMAAVMRADANLAGAFEQQVVRTLNSAERVARFVREEYLLRGKSLDLAAWVARGVIPGQEFSTISVLDAEGRVVVSTSAAVMQANYADRDYFRVPREQSHAALYVGRPMLGRATARWSVPLSLRIHAADGAFAGVVVLFVAPSQLTRFYREDAQGEPLLLEITGLDGYIRARHLGQHDSFGQPAQGLRGFQDRAKVPTGSFVDAGEVGGARRFISYRTLADYPLMVLVGTDYAAEMARFEQRRRAYLWVTALASVALLAFAAMLALALMRRRQAMLAVQEREAVFRATFNQAAMGIAHVAPDGAVLRVNATFARMLGYSAEAMARQSVFDFEDPALQSQRRQAWAEYLAGGASVVLPEVERAYRHKDGSTVWLSVAPGVVRRADGSPDFLVIVAHDISPRKRLEEKLAHSATHDGLTGLANRALFHERCTRAMETAGRLVDEPAVLYLDLDGFKAVNDEHGHGAGDALLQQVARRLEACVRARSMDTVARFGGDEFGVLLTGLAGRADVERVMVKILAELARPFDLDGTPARISASVGAAQQKASEITLPMLLAAADGAMYQAKRAGKNQFRWGN